jgi:hypothetical protein
MNFVYLPKSLVPTAEQAVQYFWDNHGIGGFRVEEEIGPTLSYRPTLQALTADRYYLCIEVNESPYPAVLEPVVLDCVTQGLPVKLYVAFPSGPLPADYKTRVDRARAHSIGVIEVSATQTQVIHPPLPLSLASLRPRPKNEFPPKYRSVLAEAENTFKAGSPAQGCLVIQQEIEQLSRKIARKTKSKNLWRGPRPGEKVPRLTDKTPWAKVMEVILDHLDHSKCPSPDRALLNRIAGMTAHRNEAGHKPNNLKALITGPGGANAVRECGRYTPGPNSGQPTLACITSRESLSSFLHLTFATFSRRSVVGTEGLNLQPTD